MARRPTFERVLVVYRKSTYQTIALERRDAHFLDLLERRDPTVRLMEQVHKQNTRSLETVVETLMGLGIKHTTMERGTVRKFQGLDLVIAVGGDGTFLNASHRMPAGVPLLGVVSSDASEGHFCATTSAAFERTMRKLLAGRLRPVLLQRLQVTIDGTPLTDLALNDVLLCHRNAAAMSRYIVSLDGAHEEQKSSGVWIATASGSTGAIGSAGGVVVPPRSKRIQFVVREPYLGRRGEYHLLRGFVQPHQRLQFASKMDQGKIYVDGPHISYPYPFGTRLTVGLSDQPLTAYGMRRDDD
jgi:NAD+ kinase